MSAKIMINGGKGVCHKETAEAIRKGISALFPCTPCVKTKLY